ncbi:type II-A CRISPR-associated protein Csn2 [Listeria aquatica]|uniref:CRISPR-associated protein csn2 n=1 Tax=Listeria aquatica FSL S10-1188 TaxID=1265818 RepID=W7B2U9_9LIST|nr:type II-A CRISPR-associated protein Csn2 [Listeria aquatica]EUJ21559.1 CRISPR-associated protein csn2 [Listeria aquatica FSL S10-1188]
MNLNFPLLDEPVKIFAGTLLVVEDVKVFSSIIQKLYQYEEANDLKLFDDKYQALKSSELMLITDVLGFDVNSPTVLKLIYSDLEKQLNEKPEVKSMIDKLTSTISELIGYELLEHELDLEGDEITILELFKSLGIKIETQSDTIFEKLMEILQVYKYLSKKKLLVLINICSYLTKTEIVEILEYISLNSVEVLIIEPRRVDGCIQYILDEDYFLSTEDLVE